jgi:Putative Actinobacterial Holin-X, holin superfamily III
VDDMLEHNGDVELRERAMGDLLKQLAQETSTLVRQEVELAKAEVSEKGRQAGKGAGMFGAAGILGLLALGALTAAAILALDLVVAGWLAALIVATVEGATAGLLALAGKARVQEATPPAPQTVETVKEDIEWAKTRGRSAKTSSGPANR